MDNQITSPRSLISAGFISTIPILVLGYFSVAASDTLIQQMEFWYSDPTLVSVWGSALVHHSIAHLINNILAYLAAIVPAYAIFSFRKQLRAFWWALFGFASIVPPLVRGLDWWILAKQLELVAPTATARGFSGIVSAVAGMLLVVSLFTLRDRHGNRYTSRIIFLISCSLVGYITLVKPSIPRTLFVVAVVASIGYIYYWAQSIENPLIHLETLPTTDIVTCIGITVATLFLIAIVPIDFINDGTYTGAIAHSVGFLSGIALTALSIHFQGN